ncbi:MULTISPECIES: class I SAM-dependent methyltransferase [Paraburkholderia]|jgi:SAM-dependent methyltransferase|uniref:class I SAM-dependent methyltransferase n=1 Tax=Paraburkholderia TaxID=1822464 RepID=UPI002252C15B|nr:MULTISPECIES: class I SAM-dependent methyltransferase [Paraburkholderia]MCX4177452.1 class I SAM-dependent methyltransferase [Paraburkholderia madseniana]MDQ6465441.1 class I SAM-dependent methyltransferase [Paraburkholderia madseniana]
MNDLLSSVAHYYTDKIQRFGSEPRGVDWNGREGQVLRFAQLCKVLDPDTPFSVTDVGCGYGSLLDFLETHFERCDYVGVDISDAMIGAATQLHAGKAHARFELGTRPSQPTDFAVASGIFNVKLNSSDSEWRSYIETTLENMHEFTSRGFAFNCLTAYSDQDKMRPDLHYADPCELFDICKRKYSRNVALLHDYGLYEFTILVRK